MFDQWPTLLIMHDDWLTEWGTLRVRACFMLETEGENDEHLECRCALCLHGCIHPLHWSERERVRKRERERVFIWKRNDGCLDTF
jgi:hypothetical protein